MKKKFYVSAIYTSPPNTMGGNTKILIEIINNLIDKFDFVIFTTQPKTFKINIKRSTEIKIIPVQYPYKLFSYISHLSEITYISQIYFEYFKANKITKDDYFFTPSDFAPDVIPVYRLRKMYDFNWIASLFLFIPSPSENLSNQYGFPFSKYVIYYFYQKYLYSKILEKGNLFLITNDYDRKFFPKKLKDKIFAIYGGVNPEQIEKAMHNTHQIKYDAVFCSRLHPQKGISGLLDIWAEVLKEIPNAKLAVIGNGEKSYEDFLKKKAKKLLVEKNIKWLGYVNGVNKYNIYLESRIFLHATIYDNNGMVAAEALCAGLPVIMYDLPQLKKVYTLGCTKIEVGNKRQYSEVIVNLLNQKSSLDLKIRNKLIEYWNWESRIKDFSNYIGK